MTRRPTELDAWFPLDDDEHARQLAGLADLALPPDADAPPTRVVDLGCGSGRTAAPLAEGGASVLALDRDPAALDALPDHPRLIPRRADFLAPHADLAHPDGPARAALCLGHTLMHLHQPIHALELLRRLAPVLEPAAPLAIDAFPLALWREVADGYWQEGVSEDGSMQLLWEQGDNVLVLRTAAAVDPDSWSPAPHEPRLRLWSLGELELLARAAGWTGPETRPDSHLILLRSPG